MLCNDMAATDETKCPGWIWSTTDRSQVFPAIQRHDECRHPAWDDLYAKIYVLYQLAQRAGNVWPPDGEEATRRKEQFAAALYSSLMEERLDAIRWTLGECFDDGDVEDSAPGTVLEHLDKIEEGPLLPPEVFEDWGIQLPAEPPAWLRFMGKEE